MGYPLDLPAHRLRKNILFTQPERRLPVACSPGNPEAIHLCKLQPGSGSWIAINSRFFTLTFVQCG